jgi:hypothetical protein
MYVEILENFTELTVSKGNYKEINFLLILLQLAKILFPFRIINLSYIASISCICIHILRAILLLHL